jgi:hypothetical protein
MKAILLDFVSRWKMFYILMTVAQFAADLIVPPIASLPLVICSGSVLLSFDLGRGTARVFRSLPVPPKELGCVWWTLSVILPLTGSAAILVTTTLLRAAFGYSSLISVAQLPLWGLLCVTWLGSSFYLLTNSTSASLGTNPGNVKSRVIALLWGVSIPGAFFLCMKMPQEWDKLLPWHWGLLMIGIAATCFGWLRADNITPYRTSDLQVKCIPRQRQNADYRLNTPDSKSGLLSFLREFAVNTFKMVGTAVPVFILLQTFLRKHEAEPILSNVAHVLKQPSTSYILGPMIIVMGLQWSTGIRVMRSLPISYRQLTALLVILLIAPALLAVSLIAIGDFALSGSFPSGVWLQQVTLFSCIALLVHGFLLTFGLNWKSYFLTIVPIFAMTPLIGIFAPRVSTSLSVSISAAGAIAGVLLIRNAITRRSQTYRHQLIWPTSR